jgi:hypothetical protein
MDPDVLDCYIADGNPWFGLTDSLAERVEHAPRPIAIRFFHLLGANVDRPPDRFVHSEIFEVKVLDNSCAFVAWIRFDVD